ncbi:MAG TPA: DUF885 domain-containing protein [Gemmatimonadaceae bacterium]
MIRFSRVVVTFVLAAAPALSAQKPSDAMTRVEHIADEYMAAYFQRSPSAAITYGIPGARVDRFEDNSLEALKRWRASEDGWLKSLESVDAAALAGTSYATTYGLLLETLRASRQARVCRRELWPVSSLSGAPARYAVLANMQPVGNDSLRRAALLRWSAFPHYLATEMANEREGLRRGYTAPKDVVRREIEQIDGLVMLSPERSPFFAPATHDSTAAFRVAFESLVRDSIATALARYRDFLSNEYLPKARSAIAVAANPNGAACYRALVRQSATVDRDPRALHELGLQRMDSVEREMRAIAQRSFGTSDLRALFLRIRTDTQYTFHSQAEVVKYADSLIARAKAAMPKWFGILPKGDVRVEPFPAFQERSAPPGQYFAGSDDGTRPGIYRVNTYQPEQLGRGVLEDVTFHEAIPGHHLQIAIAHERTHAHPVTRYLGNSGFSEGWGLYSERLADEMGLYDTDLGRLGMLNGESFRAARLVVDAGIHALGWTRQQGIDYFLQHTSNSPAQIAAEVDRYISEPGQATAYMIGALEIRRLRGEAQRALGSRFDIRAFHDRVLEDGTVTLPMLDTKIHRWIIGQQRMSVR